MAGGQYILTSLILRISYSPEVLSLYWFLAVSLVREPDREYGASVCPRGPGCSACPINTLGAPRPVTLFIDPDGEA